MTKTQALAEFYSSFGMEAYPTNSVPKDTTFPWLTYETSINEFGEDTAIQIHLYFYTKTESIPNAKVEEIYNRIGYGGINIPYDDGCIWIKRGSPFSISQSDKDNTMIKHRMINLVLQYF